MSFETVDYKKKEKSLINLSKQNQPVESIILEIGV
eukprot:UN19137